MIRKRIQVFGSVQGVGFRYRVSYAAKKFGVTGWVRNEADGSVIMELQGTEAQLDQVFLLAEQGRYVEIQNMKVKSLPVDIEERSFYTLD